MPIEYRPLPELQFPNVNLLGAYAQGQAIQQNQLQAEKTAQAMELAGRAAQRQEEEAARNAQIKLQELNDKIRAHALSRLSAVPEGDQAGYMKTIEEFKDIFPSEYEVLSKRKWDADTRRMVLLTPEQQYAQETKDVLTPTGQTQTMRYPKFGGGAATPIGNLVGAAQFEPVEDKDKNIVGYRVKGTTRTISPEEAQRQMTAAPSGNLTEQLTAGFEGFRATPYYDVNAYRTGFGSDTVTREDGTVEKVRKGMAPITEEDARRDLRRRLETEFAPKAAAKVGEDVWARLPENVRAPLTSIAYNYGTIPSRIVPAVQSGNPETIARAIESLAGDNKGINAGRRMQEANVARGTALPGSRAVPAFAAGGVPQFMGGPQIQPPINMMAAPLTPVNAMAAPAPLPPVPSMELTPKQIFPIGTKKAAQQQAALDTIKDIGLDPATGSDRVEGLINASTSGKLESMGAAIPGFFGVATSGQEAIANLKVILNDAVLSKLGGSLGAQISDPDRQFIEKSMGDIANEEIPASARLSAWREVKRRLAKYADIDLPKPETKSRGVAGETPVEKPVERKRIKFMELGD